MSMDATPKDRARFVMGLGGMVGGVLGMLAGGVSEVFTGGGSSAVSLPVVAEYGAITIVSAGQAANALGKMFHFEVSMKSDGKGEAETELDTEKWNKGSFDSAEDYLDYHYGKHGEEVGATSREQYLRKAEEFARTAKKGSTKSQVDGAVEGTIRYKNNGKYIDIAPDGSIVSFGKQ